MIKSTKFRFLCVALGAAGLSACNASSPEGGISFCPKGVYWFSSDYRSERIVFFPKSHTLQRADVTYSYEVTQAEQYEIIMDPYIILLPKNRVYPPSIRELEVHGIKFKIDTIKEGEEWRYYSEKQEGVNQKLTQDQYVVRTSVKYSRRQGVTDIDFQIIPTLGGGVDDQFGYYKCSDSRLFSFN